MDDIVSEMYFRDGHFYPARQLPGSCFGNNVIYEVIRFMEGKPIFPEDHLYRLISSAKKENYAIPDYRTLIHGIKLFAEKVSLESGNLKVLLCYTAYGEAFSFYVYQVKHLYPDNKLYHKGVVTITTMFERQNPTVKKWNPHFRSKTEAVRQEKAVFEVLIIDREGNVTEGSKSNLFFLKGDKLAPPPESSVLPGITRHKVIELCWHFNIPLSFRKIPYHQLADYDEAFLTGTSPKILPIRQIDNFEFGISSQIIRKLMQAYERLIREEISRSSF